MEEKRFRDRTLINYRLEKLAKMMQSWKTPPPLELKNVRRILKQAWSEKTAYNKARLTTSKPTKSKGQCYVTALLINKLFNGEVIKGKVFGETHYWNRIGKVEFDLTSDQYSGDGFAPITKGKPLKLASKGNNRRFQLLLKKFQVQQARLNLPLFAEPLIYKTFDSGEIGITDGANTLTIRTAHSTKKLSLPKTDDHLVTSVGIKLTDEQVKRILENPKIYFKLLLDLQSLQWQCSPQDLKKALFLLFENVFAGETLIEKFKTIVDQLLRYSAFDVHFKINTARLIPSGYIIRLDLNRFCLVNKDGVTHLLILGTGIDRTKRLFQYVKCLEPIPFGCLHRFRGTQREYSIIASVVGKHMPVLAAVLAPESHLT